MAPICTWYDLPIENTGFPFPRKINEDGGQAQKIRKVRSFGHNEFEIYVLQPTYS